MIRRPDYDELISRVNALEKEMANPEFSESALRKACDCLECVTDDLFGPLMIIDHDFKIVEMNERFGQRFGLQREDAIGQPCFKVTHGLQEPCFQSDLSCPAKAVMENGKPHKAKTLVKKNTGTVSSENVLAFPLLDDNGEVAHVVEMYHPDLPSSEEQGDKNERERLEGVIEMAGAVCLELNQPLQSLSFHCERLLKAISEENLLYDQIDWILKKIDKMSEILDKLQHIATYATKDHVEGVKIVDIDRASRIE